MMMLQTLILIVVETFISLGLAFFSGALFTVTGSFNLASLYIVSVASSFYIASLRNVFIDNPILRQNITFLELIIIGLGGVALFRFINFYFFKNNSTANKVFGLAQIIFFVTSIIVAVYGFENLSVSKILAFTPLSLFVTPAFIFWFINFVKGRELDSFLPFTLFGLFLIASIVIRSIRFEIDNNLLTSRDIFQLLVLVAFFFLYIGFSRAYKRLANLQY